MAQYQGSSNGGFSNFIMGALVGGIVGLLFAPQEGARTRQMLRENLDNASNSLKEGANTAVENVNQKKDEFVDQAKGKIKEALDSTDLDEKAKSAMDEGMNNS